MGFSLLFSRHDRWHTRIDGNAHHDGYFHYSREPWHGCQHGQCLRTQAAIVADLQYREISSIPSIQRVPVSFKFFRFLWRVGRLGVRDLKAAIWSSRSALSISGSPTVGSPSTWISESIRLQLPFSRHDRRHTRIDENAHHDGHFQYRLTT